MIGSTSSYVVSFFILFKFRNIHSCFTPHPWACWRGLFSHYTRTCAHVHTQLYWQEEIDPRGVDQEEIHSFLCSALPANPLISLEFQTLVPVKHNNWKKRKIKEVVHWLAHIFDHIGLMYVQSAQHTDNWSQGTVHRWTIQALVLYLPSSEFSQSFLDKD